MSITQDQAAGAHDQVAAPESSRPAAASGFDDVSTSRAGADGSAPRGRTLGPRQRTAVISWAAFAATFGAARAVTYAIKNNRGRVGDAQVGGVHLHHYLWGIQLLAASGGLAIHGGDRVREHALVSAGYGAGAALVVDEFALLVHLKDVYRTKKGRLSVLLGLGLIGSVGASFAVIAALRSRRRHGADETPGAPTPQ